jgi:uncharacterized membrane protein (DUF485 family)
MLHEPAVQVHEAEKVSQTKARLGLWLFGAYCLVYGGFVAINVLWPRLLATRGLLGMNLAVTYGFGLIVLAIVMGLVYNHLCTRIEDRAIAAAAAAAATAKPAVGREDAP